MPASMHDKGYKRILSKKRNFLDLLKRHIKTQWVDQINEDDLELMNNQFILKDFRDKEADIIYRAKAGAQDVVFYVLLELQSVVDQTMPFRLLIYMVELMRRIFEGTDEKIRELKSFRLPAVVPIVLYNGGAEWSAVRSFKEYLAGYALFEPNIIDFQYLLVNINKIREEELLDAANLINTVLYLDQQNTARELYRKLARTAKMLGKLSDDQKIDLNAWLNDVLIKKIRRVLPDADELEMVIELFAKGDGEPMVYAIERMIDEIEEKAREKGREAGEKVGRETGEKIGESHVITLFEEGYSLDQIKKMLEYKPLSE
jgi:predicted transposase/invertase (TIGR01784 family)